jgi:hypothetical protein
MVGSLRKTEWQDTTEFECLTCFWLIILHAPLSRDTKSLCNARCKTMNEEDIEWGSVVQHLKTIVESFQDLVGGCRE